MPVPSQSLDATEKTADEYACVDPGLQLPLLRQNKWGFFVEWWAGSELSHVPDYMPLLKWHLFLPHSIPHSNHTENPKSGEGERFVHSVREELTLWLLSLPHF